MSHEASPYYYFSVNLKYSHAHMDILARNSSGRVTLQLIAQI